MPPKWWFFFNKSEQEQPVASYGQKKKKGSVSRLCSLASALPFVPWHPWNETELCIRKNVTRGGKKNPICARSIGLEKKEMSERSRNMWMSHLTVHHSAVNNRVSLGSFVSDVHYTRNGVISEKVSFSFKTPSKWALLLTNPNTSEGFSGSWSGFLALGASISSPATSAQRRVEGRATITHFSGADGENKPNSR